MEWTTDIGYGDYDTARRLFDWEIPNDYNIAWDVVQRHSDTRGKVALFQAYPDGRRETYTFADIDRLSNQVADSLADLGVGFGDRVALMMPQKPAYVLTHLACWKLGAVSVPISVLFGDKGLEYRLTDSDAVGLVYDESVAETVNEVRDACPNLEHLIQVDGDPTDDARSFEEVRRSGATEFALRSTDAETPAVIMYSSGTTGPPKGIVHTHGVWIGHYPGFQMGYNLDLENTVFWTPSEWSWFGSLVGTVWPSWHFGRPIVGYPMAQFDPETAFELMAEFDVTGAFLAPTAVRMLMDVEDPLQQYDLGLETIVSGGEPVTSDIHEWADTALAGTVVNEAYGRSEGTTLVANCEAWFEPRPGSMGKPVPGHDVAIVDSETGEEKPRGEVGEIAVRQGDDPALFEEYLNLPEKTAESRVGDWDLTGDLAEMDEDGYIWYKSRTDDVIITSGYRVGPSEVEDAILEHASVLQVGVIGVPDETRGEVIKAFVQPVDGVDGTDELRGEIQDLVRDTLAKHEYPREIEFVEELPQTTTGKIQRKDLREREGLE